MKVPKLNTLGQIVEIVDSKDLTPEEWARVKSDRDGALRPEKDES